MSIQTWASTPNRSTYLEVNLPEVQLGSSIYRISRNADQIRKAKTRGFPASGKVRHLPGIGWALRPGLTDWTNAITTAAPTQSFLLNGVMLDILGFNVPFGDNTVVQHYAYKNPADLPGVLTPGTLVPQGMPVWRRVVPAGETWSNELTADVLAVPKPPLPSQHVAMDRLMVGRQTYGPNTPFVLGWYSAPLAGAVQDTYLTFYFGGGSDTDPAPSRNRGYWALSVRGDGSAFLHEQEGAGWEERLEFRYSNEPRSRGGLNTLEILPIGRDRIAFRSAAVASDIKEGGAWFAASTFRRDQTQFLTKLYRHSKADCGHEHKKNVTGSGNLRIDLRRDSRMQLFVGLQTYGTQEDLYDEPLSIPAVPGGTKLRVLATTDEPAGTSVTVRLFDATTHAELNEGEDGLQITNAGQRHYYARIRLTGDGTRTPLLVDYTVIVDGFLNFTQPTPIRVNDVLSASVTGPDYNAPDHEMALVEVDDSTNLLPLLRQRSRVRSRLCTECQDYDPIFQEYFQSFSVLLDGETAYTPAQPKAGPPLENGVVPQWPSVNWHGFHITMAGMWARIDDQRLQSDFSLIDPDTGLGWKVTDLIRGLLYAAGFPAQFIDIPSLDVRVFLSDKQEDNWIKMGTSITAAVLYYAFLYTDLLFFWDGNAKKDPAEDMDGLWRAITYPEPPFNILWNFTKNAPASGLVHLHESYPEDTSFITECRPWIEPPELNRLRLVGGPDSSGRKLELEDYNRRSYRATQDQPEPSQAHPDYIGHEVKRTYSMPELTTPEALHIVWRRLWKATAFGRERDDFEAPLVLIRDWSDPYQIRPRSLRIGDMVRVDGRAFMITCCNPAVNSRRNDLNQTAHYEGFFRDE